MAVADLRAALVASCLQGAMPPVDLRAVCWVRPMEGLVAVAWRACLVRGGFSGGAARLAAFWRLATVWELARARGS